jgi:phosphoribosylformimino-5-aminoimidazole carboxamide ribotide isomerase
MIIPCIDLMDGVVVQLVQGREKALEAGDASDVLRRFAAFACIQVIDLDAAMDKGSNEPIIATLANRARIRAGGGIRTVEKAQRLVALGVEKVILGTACFTSGGIHHEFLGSLAQTIPPAKIVIALDSKEGRIVVQGWRESLNIGAENVIRELEPYCGGFLCTYVDKEGMMQGTDLEWFRKLHEITAHEITAAGGITSYEEVRALLEMKVHAALGMAIYTGRMDLARLAAMEAEN